MYILNIQTGLAVVRNASRVLLQYMYFTWLFNSIYREIIGAKKTRLFRAWFLSCLHRTQWNFDFEESSHICVFISRMNGGGWARCLHACCRAHSYVFKKRRVEFQTLQYLTFHIPSIPCVDVPPVRLAIRAIPTLWIKCGLM